MAGGWTSDGAVQEQISHSLEDEVKRIRNQLPSGASLLECEECGDEIPAARRRALPGVRLCLECQAESEKNQKNAGLYNRRASKDSQLR